MSRVIILVPTSANPTSVRVIATTIFFFVFVFFTSVIAKTICYTQSINMLNTGPITT
jgi:hypothetical protein